MRIRTLRSMTAGLAVVTAGLGIAPAQAAEEMTFTNLQLLANQPISAAGARVRVAGRLVHTGTGTGVPGATVAIVLAQGDDEFALQGELGLQKLHAAWPTQTGDPNLPPQVAQFGLDNRTDPTGWFHAVGVIPAGINGAFAVKVRAVTLLGTGILGLGQGGDIEAMVSKAGETIKVDTAPPTNVSACVVQGAACITPLPAKLGSNAQIRLSATDDSPVTFKCGVTQKDGGVVVVRQQPTTCDSTWTLPTFDEGIDYALRIVATDAATTDPYLLQPVLPRPTNPNTSTTDSSLFEIDRTAPARIAIVPGFPIDEPHTGAATFTFDSAGEAAPSFQCGLVPATAARPATLSACSKTTTWTPGTAPFAPAVGRWRVYAGACDDAVPANCIPRTSWAVATFDQV